MLLLITAYNLTLSVHLCQFIKESLNIPLFIIRLLKKRQKKLQEPNKDTRRFNYWGGGLITGEEV